MRVRICACGNNDEIPTDDNRKTKEQSLIVRRRTLERQTRGGRVSRLRVQTTASELSADLQDDSKCKDNDVPVDVAVILQSVRKHFRVRGAVRSKLTLECDRCLTCFEHPVEERFEVWLSASGDEEVSGLTEEQIRSLEAIESFSGADAEADLAPHARDALLLGFPTKALCSPDCEGISLPAGSSDTVTYGGQESPSNSSRGIFSSDMRERLKSFASSLDQ